MDYTPTRGTSGGANIVKSPLDAKQSYDTKVEYGGSTLGQSSTKKAVVNPQTYPEGQGPNLSAKYKYPNVVQDTSPLPPVGSSGERSV